jgi:hypothetical protein
MKFHVQLRIWSDDADHREVLLAPAQATAAIIGEVEWSDIEQSITRR